MAIYFPPPPAQSGSAQPYAPSKGNPANILQPNSPPPMSDGGPTLSIHESAMLAQPNPYVQIVMDSRGLPFAPKKLDPGDLNNPPNNPPTTDGGLNVEMMEAVFQAQPNPYVPLVIDPKGQPFAPKNLDPNDLNNPPNNPPTSDGGLVASMMGVIFEAQPSPWTYLFSGASQPYAPRRISPGVPGQQINNPPFQHPMRTVWYASITWDNQQGPLDPWGRWPYTFVGGSGPYMPRHVDPNDIAVPVNNPPFGLWTRMRPQPPMLPGWGDIFYNPQFFPHVAQITAEITARFGRGYILGV